MLTMQSLLRFMVAQGASDQTLDAAKQAGQSMAHALKSN